MNYETIGDVITAIVACETKEDAQTVIDKYEEDNPGYAKGNIGYMIGYIEPPERRKAVQKLFTECIHPIFGKEY